MAKIVTRTGVKKFTITCDDPGEPWSLLEADYSVSPPLIKFTFRHLFEPNETWLKVDAEIATLEQ